MSQLAFKRQEVARFVIPIYDTYRDVPVEDLLALDAQLAGIGVDDGQAMALARCALSIDCSFGPSRTYFGSTKQRLQLLRPIARA